MKHNVLATTIYDKNINSLKLENKDIKDFLMKRKQNNADENFVGVEKIDERKILYIIKEGMQYQLDSLYSSALILDKWFEQFENRNFRSRFLLFGLGNGMYVDRIIREVEEESVVIVVEPSIQIFTKVIEEFDISNILINKQVHLIINGVSEKKFLDLLREYVLYDDLIGAVATAYLNYGILYNEANKEFDNDIKFHSNSLEAAHTVIERMGWRYYRNSMFNYMDMIKGKSLIALKKSIPNDIPAFIVASGPSLDNNIMELKNIKNRGFIIAADSAVSVLVKNNIIPNLMMTIDAFKLPKHFEHDNIKNIPLVCSQTCNRDLLMLHNGHRYFVNDDNTYVERFYKTINKIYPKLYSGGSVATSIFALLEALEFKTIVLVGQDLAYFERKMYSESAVRGNEHVEIDAPGTIWVKGIDGNPILSTYEFQIYRNWFEEEIEFNKEIRVIDATEGGALIKGAIIQTLGETIQKECKKEADIDYIMKNVPDRFTVEEKKAYVKYMNNLPNEMKKIQDKVKEQMRLILILENLIKKNLSTSKLMVSMLKQASKKADEIEKIDAFFYLNNYIQQFIKQEIVGDIYAKSDNSQEDVITSVNQLKSYYSIMQNKLPEVIHNILYVIETYKEEYKELYEEINYLN